jgi:hypothetical protein
MDHSDRKKHRKKRKEKASKKRTEREAKLSARAAVDPVFAAKLKQQKEVAAVGKVKGTTVVQSAVGGGTKAGKEFAKSAAFFANLQESVAQEKRDEGKPQKKRAKTGDAEQRAPGGASKYKL